MLIRRSAYILNYPLSFIMNHIFNTALTTLLISVAQTSAQSVITLSTLEDSIMVGSGDHASNVAPLAPGKVWFTGTHSGSVRARTSEDGL